jgi:hypothetical protein
VVDDDGVMWDKTLLIVRACDADPEGSHVETRVEFDHAPSGEEVGRLKRATRASFREVYGREPARFGIALLPFVAEIDAIEE